MSGRYMTYNGEGLEQGMYTLAEARAKWSDVDFDAETQTISVDGDYRLMAARVESIVGDADGSGDIGVIVRQALRDDAHATAEAIAEIVREARADAAAERQ